MIHDARSEEPNIVRFVATWLLSLAMAQGPA